MDRPAVNKSNFIADSKITLCFPNGEDTESYLVLGRRDPCAASDGSFMDNHDLGIVERSKSDDGGMTG